MRLSSDEIKGALSGLFILVFISFCTIGGIIQSINEKPPKNILSDGKYIYHCTREGIVYFEPKYDFADQRKSLVPYYDKEGKIVTCNYQNE